MHRGKNTKVEQIAIAKEKAEEEYQAYKQLAAKSKEEYLHDFKQLYSYMRHGKAVIDLYAAMTKAGLNTDNDPTLAITRADSTKTRFIKREHGAGAFQLYDNRDIPTLKYDVSRRWSTSVSIPANTFPEWSKPEGATMGIARQTLETIVPVVPASIRTAIRGHLRNYHVLWEVEKWEPIPPRDPMLLKRVTPNLFVVLGTWDLTPLERAIIKGRLA